MSWLTFQILPSLQTFKILSDTIGFRQWMKSTHPKVSPDELFDGYKFSLECCINCFVDGMCGDQLLGIENDFLLDRALVHPVPLEQIDNTCEKTIFLKNLRPFVKSIFRSSNFEELQLNVGIFNETITKRYSQIIEKNIVLSKDISFDRNVANDFWLIDFAHTFLVQINNNGPTANSTHPFNLSWTSKERKDYFLRGYSYAIQFLWYQLIGENRFNQTKLSQIHLADSWREYTYIKNEEDDNSLSSIMNREFKLEEQTSLDSYFYWIKREITSPLHDQFGVPVHTIDDKFHFNTDGYNKYSLFGDLLDKKGVNGIKSNMGPFDKINERLYWFPFEVVDTRKSHMHHGTSSFNTMIAGTVALHNPEVSGLPKVVVTKFTHPHSSDLEMNDYSYGILIDTKSASGHFASGWVIFQDVCGDYSGFSGGEYRSSEKLISKYLKEDRIELRELTISLEKFKEFTSPQIRNALQKSILEENKLFVDILQKSRAALFELFVYKICVEFYRSRYSIEHGIGQNTTEGEKDIVVKNDNEVILIECKLNPQNCNLQQVINKLEKKISTYPQPLKSCQLWFWEDVSGRGSKVLNDSSINGSSLKTIVVSNSKGEQILRGVNLSLLRYIMKDYLN